ncbi:uncharacterized protein F5891DRAFT_952796, partial [Suillus fuscotomentosus]
MPARYADYIPAGPTNLPHLPAPPPDSPPNRVINDLPDYQPILIPYQTAPDALGLFRIYAQKPTLIPTGNEGLDVIADALTFETQGNSHLVHSQIDPGLPSQEIRLEDIFSPFSSPTTGLLMCRQYSGANSKSSAKMKHLTREFLNNDVYRREDM